MPVNEHSEPRPKTFFLNEQHELTREERAGGGALPKYAPIDWASRGKRIHRSISQVKNSILNSTDPLRETRFFLLAKPVKEVAKESQDKKKAPDGTYAEETRYSEEHSRVFRRLGLDLLQVNDDGTATVHARPERLEQLLLLSDNLEEKGLREQAKWSTVGAFGTIPLWLRVDREWLEDIPARESVDTIIELQPLLFRTETEAVARAISQRLSRQHDEKLIGTGTDFSGRQWFRGKLNRQTIASLAEEFFSIQSLHPPLVSIAAAGKKGGRSVNRAPEPIAAVPNVDSLPVVGVLDTGVPADHRFLGRYVRGKFRGREAIADYSGDHGSKVASRIVYGDLDFSDGLALDSLQASCSIYDMVVSRGPQDIPYKSIMPALEAVVGTAPDVRVFNFSFDTVRSLDSIQSQIAHREELIAVQDVDNFIFANDILIVVAAGNTAGQIPNPPYPNHLSDPRWRLGAWARSFNSLTCGSTVERLVPGGLVETLGWPSPFTRLGPGFCGSPKPDFSAHGGNTNSSYGHIPGLGVWCCNALGMWEDWSGTSFAAPLLAREAAYTLAELQRVCRAGSRPFAVTAKAFMVLTATSPQVEDNIRGLADVALGYGRASVDRLMNPTEGSAVLLWQGVLEGPDDIAKVQIPVPLGWMNRAERPLLRVVIAWDTPVNAAVHDLWSCRKVSVKLKTNPEARAQSFRRSTSRTHKSYPLILREYDLSRVKNEHNLDGDTWLMEISYEEVADYLPTMDFSPQQRVAFAAELVDESLESVDPQPYLQEIPIAATMISLGVPATVLRTPVEVRVLSS